MARPSSRETAIAALREWRAGEQFADSILGRLLRSSLLTERDRAFVTELFYGVLRNLTLLDSWIGLLRSNHLDENTRDLLRLGIYQLFVLKTPEHAAVHETVDLAGTRNRSLVNAVLRSAVRRKTKLLETASKQDLRVRESHPQFLIDRWTRNFGGKNTLNLCQWNNQAAPIYARINLLKISIDQFLSDYPEAQAVKESVGFVRLPSVPSNALARGHCYIQDPSTATACLQLDPVPGQVLLDACAAPGGKTGFLAQLMQNKGRIVACDREQNRLATLQTNLENLGVTAAQFVCHDWTTGKIQTDMIAPSSFDRVLVDAPCSNTGVMRRRVDLRWRLTPNDFARMHEEQVRIVRSTIPLLKPGGTLVYSTCSIEPEENQDVVKVILDEFPFLKLTDEKSLLPFRDGFDGAYAAKLVH